jgi:hypothetical protein
VKAAKRQAQDQWCGGHSNIELHAVVPLDDGRFSTGDYHPHAGHKRISENKINPFAQNKARF